MAVKEPGKTWRWQLAQWLELRWWKRYLNGRSPEEYLDWKKSYWIDFLEKLKTLPPLAGKSILDAGCGPAGIFIALDNSKVTALDPLLEKYAADLAHFQPGKYHHVTFQPMSIEEMDYTENFDIAFCLNAINHVDDIEKSFDNLVRATKTGGHLVVSVDAHRHPWLMPLFRLLPGDALHPHQYNLAAYEHFLTARGCTIMEKVLVRRENIFDYWVIVCSKNQ